jgi:hypothetical protein
VLVGIESEQLVFDYLSRVGDLAHGTSMTAAERARLVGELRTRIDRERASAGGAQNKAAVRRILTRIGEPADLVAAASGERPHVPQPRAEEGPEPPRTGLTLLTKLPGARRTPPPEPPSTGASPPHLAGMDELTANESDPDWWRVEEDGDGGATHPFGRRGALPGGDLVPGFVGGIELPEVMKPPEEAAGGTAPAKEAVPAAAPAVPDPAVEKATAAALGGAGLRRLLARRGAARKERAASGPTAGGIVELLSAALLVAGAVIGSLLPLAAGWLGAFWSPRLSRTEAKWAALGMPGVAAGGAAVWLWGRRDGRWGEPLADGGEAMRQAMADTWPVLLRVAAVLSALFLLWRARRRVGA